MKITAFIHFPFQMIKILFAWQAYTTLKFSNFPARINYHASFYIVTLLRRIVHNCPPQVPRPHLRKHCRDNQTSRSIVPCRPKARSIIRTICNKSFVTCKFLYFTEKQPPNSILDACSTPSDASVCKSHAWLSLPLTTCPQCTRKAGKRAKWHEARLFHPAQQI